MYPYSFIVIITELYNIAKKNTEGQVPKMKENLRYYLGKLLELILTLALVSLLTFGAFSIIPGDTASAILGPDASEAQLEAMRNRLGLNDPLHERYLDWIGGVFTGDLGESTFYNVPVSELIATRLPVTFGLSLLALLWVLAISIPSSILSSRHPGRLLDQIFSIIGHITFAIPPFVLSLLSILIASSVFGIFTVGRYVAPEVSFAQYISCLMLPAFCISLPKIAMTFKLLRSAILEEKSRDYVRTSRGHGLSEFKIMFTHIVPNSSVSLMTAISIVLSDLLGGSLIVEQVFNLPGLGRLLLSGINHRDFPLLSGIVLYLAFMMVILYFLCDIISSAIDPRMRLHRR